MTVRARLLPRALLCALMTLAAATTPGQAYAQSLQITTSGIVGTSCSIAAASSFGPPNFATSASVGATATVNCNTGFKVNARSAGGAIKTTAAAPSGFSNSVPYSLTVSVPLEAGSPVSATCASSTLVTGQNGCALSPGNSAGLSSGGKASLNKTAALTLAYSIPALPTRLIAGSYSDTITLTVTAVP